MKEKDSPLPTTRFEPIGDPGQCKFIRQPVHHKRTATPIRARRNVFTRVSPQHLRFAFAYPLTASNNIGAEVHEQLRMFHRSPAFVMLLHQTLKE